MSETREKVISPPQPSVAKKHFNSPGKPLKGFSILSGNSNTEDAPLPIGVTWEESVPLAPHLYRYEDAFSFQVLPPPTAGGTNPVSRILQGLRFGYYAPLSGGVPVADPPALEVGNLAYSSQWNMSYGTNPDLDYDDAVGFHNRMSGGWNFNPLGSGITYYRRRFYIEVSTVSGTFLDPNETTVIGWYMQGRTTRIPGVSAGNFLRLGAMACSAPIGDFCRVVTKKDSHGAVIATYTSGLYAYSVQGFVLTPAWNLVYQPRMSGNLFYDNGNPGAGFSNLEGLRTANASDTAWVLACPIAEA